MDNNKIRKRIKEHLDLFNYSLSQSQIEELIILYELNYGSYDENTLSLHIEKYMQNITENPDSKWKEDRRPTVYAKKIDAGAFEVPSFSKPAETFNFLISRLGTQIPFCLLSDAQKSSLVDSMYPVEVQAGTVLIREGDVGAEMYIVEDGEFDVLVGGKFTNRMQSGAVFGELALLHGIPRTATVIAVSKSKVWSADQTSFSSIRLSNQIYKLKLAVDAVEECPYLKSLLKTPENAHNVLASSPRIFLTENKSFTLKDGEIAIVLNHARVQESFEREVKPKEIIKTSFHCITNVECIILDLEKLERSKDA